MASQEEVELGLRSNQDGNWPNYSGKLEFRPLRFQDSLLLIPVIKKDKGTLSAYLTKFHGANKWSLKSAQGLVSGLVQAPWPSYTYLFHINGQPIGLISTAAVESSRECQIIISVFAEHQGHGFATAMTKSILWITERVWGFEKTWWIVDATNEASKAVAQKCGFVFDSSYEESGRNSPDKSSGLYVRLVKERPEGLADGVLQGQPLEYWHLAKDKGLLEMIIESRKPQDDEIAKQPMESKAE
jgi:RimJ/RimL family protein N-acetyltransferase